MCEKGQKMFHREAQETGSLFFLSVAIAMLIVYALRSMSGQHLAGSDWWYAVLYLLVIGVHIYGILKKPRATEKKAK